jgi:hypothetical protein
MVQGLSQSATQSGDAREHTRGPMAQAAQPTASGGHWGPSAATKEARTQGAQRAEGHPMVPLAVQTIGLEGAAAWAEGLGDRHVLTVGPLGVPPSSQRVQGIALDGGQGGGTNGMARSACGRRWGCSSPNEQLVGPGARVVRGILSDLRQDPLLTPPTVHPTPTACYLWHREKKRDTHSTPRGMWRPPPLAFSQATRMLKEQSGVFSELGHSACPPIPQEHRRHHFSPYSRSGIARGKHHGMCGHTYHSWAPHTSHTLH